jgi:hypothetical protein
VRQHGIPSRITSVLFGPVRKEARFGGVFYLAMPYKQGALESACF